MTAAGFLESVVPAALVLEWPEGARYDIAQLVLIMCGSAALPSGWLLSADWLPVKPPCAAGN